MFRGIGLREQLGKLSKLGWLDISSNSIGGKIPTSLLVIKYLRHVNIKGNKLCGEIPQGRPLNVFPKAAYAHNQTSTPTSSMEILLLSNLFLCNFKYISPELVPVQYGELSRDGEQVITVGESITEEIIKPSCEHTIELPATEARTLIWEARVVGCEVSYGAEFFPSAEDGYTVIVQKSSKFTESNDGSVISGRFKCGEARKVVLTFFNQTSEEEEGVVQVQEIKS
ncbi:hypothetical protein LXL04_033040 [Taraxacum kok-saghyz]